MSACEPWQHQWRVVAKCTVCGEEALYIQGITEEDRQRAEAAGAARERAACLAACENERVELIGPGDRAYNLGVEDCAAAIRARRS